MKKIVTLCIAVMMCIVCLSLPVSVMAATNAEIVNAIDLGLANLASTQTAGGYWNYGGYEQAATGAVVGAFMSQQSLWGTNTAAYQAKVDNAMNYLLQGASTQSLGLRGDGVSGCPGGGASCTGIYWYGYGESTYTTGIVASAIGQYAAGKGSVVATTSGPLANMTWTQIAQGVVNEFAVGQSTANTFQRGGWRYFPTDNDADGSTTQWAVLSMIYGQSLGATVPQIVKNELKNYWLANSAQDPVSGGGQYQPGSIIDHSDTGSVLISHAFVGDGKTNAQVQAALAFINTNWKDLASGGWYGNFGQPYAMWALYKGLELQIGLNDNTTILSLLDPAQANWWQDYNQWLVANQNVVDGSWAGYSSWYGPIATAWDVSILGGTVIPPQTAPEPATLLLLGLGLAGLGAIRRKM